MFHLFSQYGEIADIIARKSYKEKGQAFVAFREINSATLAKHSLNGGLLFGKEIVIIYKYIFLLLENKFF